MNSYGDLTTLKSSSYLNLTGTGDDTYLRKLLEHASRMIDKYCNRFFYVRGETRYYDGQSSPWYPPDDILSITTLKTDEDEDATFENTYTENTDFYLYPLNEYPKTLIKVSGDGSYGGFGAGTKKAIEIVGFFGYGDGYSATPYSDAGTDVNDASMTAIQTTCTVDDGTAFAYGQTILIDSEQMYITSIATHVLTITRAVNGTTGATHADNSNVYIYDYPEPITQACLITAMRSWKRKDSAYQDVVGSPETGTIIISKGIDPDVAEIIKQYRKRFL